MLDGFYIGDFFLQIGVHGGENLIAHNEGLVIFYGNKALSQREKKDDAGDKSDCQINKKYFIEKTVFYYLAV